MRLSNVASTYPSNFTYPTFLMALATLTVLVFHTFLSLPALRLFHLPRKYKPPTIHQAGSVSLFRPHASLPQRSFPQQRLDDLHISNPWNPWSLHLVSFLGSVYHTALYALLHGCSPRAWLNTWYINAPWSIHNWGRTWRQVGFIQATPLESKCWGSSFTGKCPQLLRVVLCAPPPNSNVQVLTPSTSECDLIWK